MKKLAKYFAERPGVNMNTAIARRRMERSMPGETGSLASLRYAGIAC